MWKYIGKRILEVIPTTFGILLLTFVLFNVVGGSPAAAALGQRATAQEIAKFNHLHGYDKPLILGDGNVFDSQFFHFVKNIATGDLGYSTDLEEPVSAVLKRGVGPSLSLTVPILVFGVAVALFLGLLASAYRGRTPDRLVLFVSAALMSVNYVIWVLAGQFLLAFKAEWFPIWGYENLSYLVLPVMIGVLCSLGIDVRYFRTAILDEIYKPYVLTARAKGLSRVTIMTRHVLRNALIPIVTYVSLSIPYLFTGSILLESVFGIPGLGFVALNAINSGDASVVRALVVLGALVYQFVNLLTDVLYAFLDPRVRL